MGRIIIFTGKGGVGKSSIASAHALKASQIGLKTLIVSTDIAHNLGDIFNVDFGNTEVEIAKNLWGLEINPNFEMEENFGEIQNAVLKMMKFSNDDEKETFEDIMVFPGIEELFSLLKIMGVYEKNTYDVIIIDCAPTGETLSLLKFPELINWYMEKIFPIEKVAVKLLRPVAKTLFRLELPSKEAVNDIEKLYIRMNKLQELIRNRETTSIRIVTIPEKMVIEETKRSYMYLNLYDFNVDSIYINRIIPMEVDNNFFDKWKSTQSEYIKELCLVFQGMPVYKVKWYDEEVSGIEGLSRIVEDSLKDENLLNVRKITNRESYEAVDGGYELKVYIPFGNKENFDLSESSTDIIIKVGNFKRNIPRPNSLRRYEIVKAEFFEGYLKIRFERGDFVDG